MDTDFELSFETGVARAVRPELSIVVLGEGAQAFHRRAIKKLATGEEVRASMLVARLNGVSVYVNGNEIIMTAEDLYL